MDQMMGLSICLRSLIWNLSVDVKRHWFALMWLLKTFWFSIKCGFRVSRHTVCAFDRAARFVYAHVYAVIFSVQSSPLSIQEYCYEFVKLCVDFHVVLKMMFPRFYFKNLIFGNHRVNCVFTTSCWDYEFVNSSEQMCVSMILCE